MGNEHQMCWGAVVDCRRWNPTGTCSISCTGQSACSSMTVICPENNHCDIKCVQTGSHEGGACWDADITWPTTPGLGTLEFDGWYAVIDVEFPEPEPSVPM